MHTKPVVRIFVQEISIDRAILKGVVALALEVGEHDVDMVSLGFNQRSSANLASHGVAKRGEAFTDSLRCQHDTEADAVGGVDHGLDMLGTATHAVYR